MLKLIGKSNGSVLEFPLEGKSLTIGRSPACDIVLEDKSVSRQHAIISITPKKIFIEDSDSQRGVLVNGKKISKKTTVDCGDELELGLIRLKVADIKEKMIRDTLVKVKKPVKVEVKEEKSKPSKEIVKPKASKEGKKAPVIMEKSKKSKKEEVVSKPSKIIENKFTKLIKEKLEKPMAKPTAKPTVKSKEEPAKPLKKAANLAFDDRAKNKVSLGRAKKDDKFASALSSLLKEEKAKKIQLPPKPAKEKAKVRSLETAKNLKGKKEAPPVKRKKIKLIEEEINLDFGEDTRADIVMEPPPIEEKTKNTQVNGLVQQSLQEKIEEEVQALGNQTGFTKTKSKKIKYVIGDNKEKEEQAPKSVENIATLAELANLPEDEEKASSSEQEVDASNTSFYPGINVAKLFYVMPHSNKGQEFVLDKNELTVGRADDNDIILDHPSVSRSHAKIVKNQNGYCLMDLGSANGTLVNNNKIQEITLKRGDIIQLGMIRMRFIAHGEILSYQDLEKSLRANSNKSLSFVKWLNESLINKVIFALFIFILLIVSFSVIRSKDEPAPLPQQKVEEKPPAQTSEAQKITEMAFKLGEDYFNTQDWEKAIEKFNEILIIEPDNFQAKEYLERAQAELICENNIKAAADLRKSGKGAQAIPLLEKVSSVSCYYPAAQGSIAEIKKNKSGINREAKDVPVISVKEKSKDKPAKAKEAAVKVTPREIPQEIIKEPPKESPKTAASQKMSLSDAQLIMDKVFVLYEQNDIFNALSHLNTVIEQGDNKAKSRATQYYTQIKQAQGAYDRGLEHYRAGRNSQAFAEWQTVLKTDHQILGDKKSGFAKEISKYMADEFYAEGMSEFKQEHFEAAFNSWNKGMQLDSGHERIKEGMEKLNIKAKQLYQEAYILEQINPELAKKKWQQVVSIVPPTNPYYQKSQAKLGKSVKN